MVLLEAYPYPNPLREETGSLFYRLGAAGGDGSTIADPSGKVRLRIVTVSNRLVLDRTLTGGEWLSSGGHSVPWDGRDLKGKLLSDGVYIVVVEYGSGSVHDRKLTFLLILR